MSLTLITGASGGLGEAFARLAARNGSDVMLVARTRETLEALAQELAATHHVTAYVVAIDLTAPDAALRIVEELRSKNITVDTLINNAGVGKLAPFAETPEADIATMLQLNVEALTLLTRALLPDMIRRKQGRILNVASTAAFQPGPLMAVYYASKAYVLHWSIALQNELAGTGVTVTCLCPGPTRTGFQKTAGMLDSPLFKKLHIMDAATVARIGYDAMQRGKPIAIPGLMNKLGTFGTRLVPRTWAARFARMAQEIR